MPYSNPTPSSLAHANTTRNRTTDRRARGADVYSVEFSTYPEDLFSSGAEKYGNCWCMININANAQSRETFSRGAQSVSISENERRRNTVFDARGGTVAGNIATGAVTAGVLGAAAVGGSHMILDSLRPGGALGEGLAGFAKTGAIAGATFGIATGAAALLGTSRKDMKRITDAIQLTMPNSLSATYNANWNEDNTAVLDMILRGAEVPGLLSGGMESIRNGTIAPLTEAGRVGVDLIASKALAANSVIENHGISAMLGLTANPKKEVIFQGVNFRTFTLDYRFFPSSEQEMKTIDHIIRLLKFHMHPEYITSSQWTFLYPSEFDITFFTTDGQENIWVSKIGTSVLQNVSVNYTPDGLWSNHRHGAPTGINLTLNFQELSILTKKDIAEGF